MRSIILILLISTTLLTGCTYIYGDKGVIRNRDKEYLKAKSIPPLAIPPGLSSSTMQAQFPVSNTEYPEKAKELNLNPPGI